MSTLTAGQRITIRGFEATCDDLGPMLVGMTWVDRHGVEHIVPRDPDGSWWTQSVLATECHPVPETPPVEFRRGDEVRVELCPTWGVGIMLKPTLGNPSVWHVDFENRHGVPDNVHVARLQPVDPSKVTVDRDVALVALDAMENGGRRPKTAKRLRAALGVASPDPTSDEPKCPDCRHRWKVHSAHGGCLVIACRCTERRPAQVESDDIEFRLRAALQRVHSDPLPGTGDDHASSPVAAEAAPPKPAAWLYVGPDKAVERIRRIEPLPAMSSYYRPLWVIGEGQALVDIEALVSKVVDLVRSDEWEDAPCDEVVRAALAAASEATS